MKQTKVHSTHVVCSSTRTTSKILLSLSLSDINRCDLRVISSRCVRKKKTLVVKNQYDALASRVSFNLYLSLFLLCRKEPFFCFVLPPSGVLPSSLTNYSWERPFCQLRRCFPSPLSLLPFDVTRRDPKYTSTQRPRRPLCNRWP